MPKHLDEGFTRNTCHLISSFGRYLPPPPLWVLPGGKDLSNKNEGARNALRGRIYGDTTHLR